MSSQLLFDYEAGRQGKNNGINQAVNHANEVSPGWADRAYQFLLKFLANHNGAFMAEEVRSYAALMDFELPPSNRAWGGVIVRAKIAGIIESCGTKQVRNKKAHCANAGLWRQVKNYNL